MKIQKITAKSQHKQKEKDQPLEEQATIKRKLKQPKLKQPYY